MNQCLSLVRVASGLAVAILASAPAHAAVESFAKLANLSVTLTDLNPYDGIAPSIRFADDVTTFITVRAEVGTAAYENLPGAFAPFQTDLRDGVSQATGKVVGGRVASDGSFSGAELAVSTAARGEGRAYGSPEAFIYSPYGTGPSYFTLSAGTQATFSALATARVDMTGGFEAQSGSATATLSVFGADRQSQYQSDTAAAWVPEIGSGSDSQHRLLTVSFGNIGSVPLDGYFNATVNADAFTGIAPVPEPETWALMGCGLVAVLGATRRAQRKAAVPAA